MSIIYTQSTKINQNQRYINLKYSHPNYIKCIYNLYMESIPPPLPSQHPNQSSLPPPLFKPPTSKSSGPPIPKDGKLLTSQSHGLKESSVCVN